VLFCTVFVKPTTLYHVFTIQPQFNSKTLFKEGDPVNWVNTKEPFY